ncbi:MAG: polysaccharide biosynthesis protein [Phycisphaerales bacterium]
MPESTSDQPRLWTRAVIIGTPATCTALAAQFETFAPERRPVGCLLTEPAHRQPLLDVIGFAEDLERIHKAHAFSFAIVSLPSTAGALATRLRARLRSLGIESRWVPALEDVIDAPPAISTSSPIDLVELIGRTPYGIDRREVSRTIGGKRVLITGAGGSIGSEIARIAATFRPEQLVLMERSENALFEIDRQIARRFPDVPRRAVLHDVVDADATLRLCVALKPQVVFHSAAHKHVPLMEDHPAHAVTNNFFGTKSIADAANAVGAERFVMISSDKAVNPTSVMGATKRLAEMYVQSLHRAGGASGRTSFSMVRFGNVLGSACSVLPIWGAQLAEGGPITVTDPRMTRYFMTIHEAAMLVIQSAAIDARAQHAASVYVLDMGEPVRILDLAQRFVTLSGFTPRLPETSPLPFAGPIVDVTFTGARPGEKLHEELAYAAESLRPTPFPGINAWTGMLPADFDAAELVAELGTARVSPDRRAVLEIIRKNVPEMRKADLAEPIPARGQPAAA